MACEDDAFFFEMGNMKKGKKDMVIPLYFVGELCCINFWEWRLWGYVVTTTFITLHFGVGMALRFCCTSWKKYARGIIA